MEAEWTNPIPTGLVVIARDVTGQVITRISSNRDLLGAIHTARCVLRLKVGATHAEIHHREHTTSNYPHKPIASLSRDDLAEEAVR
jgi:hypothetical protein